MLEKHLRSAKSGIEETPEGKVFLTVHVPSPKLVITGAVHISQALAPMGQLLGYDVTIVDPRTAFASIERFPDVKVIAEWPDVALPPLGIDHYTAFVALTHDPKIDDPALTHRAEERLLLHRRARLAENPRPPRRAAEGRARLHRRRHRPHPCADRARHRRGVAGGDRGRDHGRDHAARCAKSRHESARHEVRPGPAAGGAGATAVHTIRQGALVLKKGTLIGPAEVAALEAAGIKDIVVARLEPGDVSEDKAAAEIAEAVAGQGVHVDRAFTGRANLFAEQAGVLVVDKDAIDRLNRVDEAITFATLPAFKPVVEGEMIATVKIIPFAVERSGAQGGAGGGGQAVHPRRALQDQEGRRGLDPAAGPRDQGGREDAAGDGGRVWRRPARPSSPSAACRTSRARSPRRSTRC